MHKIKYIFGLILFYLFIPNVGAVSYDIKTEVSSIGNNKYDIKLTLADMKDVKYGFESCSMNIEFNGGVKLNGEVRTIGNWNMEKGEIYLFDTATPVKTNTSFSVIPVLVSSNGAVILKNILCFADDDEIEIEEKVINLTYIDESSNNNNDSNNDNGGSNNVANDDVSEKNEDDSNCDLSDIILSEGIIEFDPNIIEYEISIDDIDSLMVEPRLVNPRARYSVIKTDDKVIIEVTAVDGTMKNYTLLVTQKNNSELAKEKNNKYVPIFIGIICILVLINIVRINKNIKSKG